MNEYNKSIKELLKDFEELQITEIVKQVNTNIGAPTGSIGINFFNLENYERGEPSNPFKNYEASKKEEWQQKSPIILEEDQLLIKNLNPKIL